MSDNHKELQRLCEPVTAIEMSEVVSAFQHTPIGMTLRRMAWEIENSRERLEELEAENQRLRAYLADRDQTAWEKSE